MSIEKVRNMGVHSGFKNIRILEALCLFFIFFPYIGPIDGIDTQPFAFLISLVCLTRVKNIDYNAIAIASLVVFVSLMHIIIFNYNVNLIYIARSFFPIITAYLVYQLISSGYIVPNKRVIIVACAVYIAVALVQRFVYAEFLTALVSRPEDDVLLLAETGRGVRSLAPEPAQFGHTLTILNVILIFVSFFRRGFSGKEFNILMVASIFLFVSNFILSSSAYSLAIHAIILLIVMILFRPMWAISLIPMYFLYYFISTTDFFINSRLGSIINTFSENPEGLFQFGAIYRLLNIPLSILSSLEFGPFGAGNSDKMMTISLRFFDSTYIFFVSSRNTGGLIEFFLQFGVFCIFHLMLIFYIIKKSVAGFRCHSRYRVGTTRIIVIYFAAVFLLCFQYGSTFNPMLWMVLAAGCIKVHKMQMLGRVDG
jgi:hypothetical protein